jgi:hypothetical protein
MLLTKFRFIWPSGFRGEYFLISANQKKVLPMAAMFVDGSGQNGRSVIKHGNHMQFLFLIGKFL